MEYIAMEDDDNDELFDDDDNEHDVISLHRYHISSYLYDDNDGIVSYATQSQINIIHGTTDC
jgi:hypothetical protein